MVAVQFSCPHCSGLFQVDAAMSGQQVACPHCGGLVALPPMGGPAQERPMAPSPPPPASYGQQAAGAARPQRPLRAVPLGSTPPSGAGNVRSMLPPSAAGSGTAGTPRPSGRPRVPAVPGEAARLQRSSYPAGSSVLLPTEDGGYVTVREPVKTIGRGDDAIELRSLSAEERKRRKFKKNLVLWGFGLLIIGITLALLLLVGPIG